MARVKVVPKPVAVEAEQYLSERGENGKIVSPFKSYADADGTVVRAGHEDYVIFDGGKVDVFSKEEFAVRFEPEEAWEAELETARSVAFEEGKAAGLKKAEEQKGTKPVKGKALDPASSTKSPEGSN